jgi:hypothetical protein
VKKKGSFYRSKHNALKFRLGSANKAKTAIANKIARAIFFVLGGKGYKDLGYMRGDPREALIEKRVRQLKALGVKIEHQNNQMIYSIKEVKVEQSGIVVQ